MKPVFATLSLASLLALAALAIGLLGNRIAPTPAALTGTALFVAMMHFSGRIED